MSTAQSVHDRLHAALMHVLLRNDHQSARAELAWALAASPDDHRTHAILTALRAVFPSFTLSCGGKAAVREAAAAMARLRKSSPEYWAYLARCLNELALRRCGAADDDACREGASPPTSQRAKPVARELHYEALCAANAALRLCGERHAKAWSERCLSKVCLGFPIAAVEDADYALRRYFPGSLPLQACAAVAAAACGRPERLATMLRAMRDGGKDAEAELWCRRLGVQVQVQVQEQEQGSS